MRARIFAATLLAMLAAPPSLAAVTRTDHYVPVRSTAPAMAGQEARIYVREVRAARTAKPRGVVLFVHGAGTPAEVSFDVPYADYSWMAYLAEAGFDTFAMDMTGYGRSTRPSAMADPCNMPKARQAEFKAPVGCTASRATAITTIASDWDDIAAVVDHLLALRHVRQVALVAWSQGGPRTAGYTAAHPDKVSRLVVLAPAYNHDGPAAAPDPLPTIDGAMTVQTRADFIANWDRQVGCPGQYEPAAAQSVWDEMMASDPIGAAWTPAARRAPAVPSWGFNRAVAAKMTTPYLMVAGAHDKQVPPDRVRDLYADLGARQRVLVDLACASHNAMWEKNHLLLFKASRDWLTTGKVGGVSRGIVRLGY